MRTLEEKQRQIEGLQKERESLPEYSYFGDNNWEAIDAVILMLKGRMTYSNYENDEYHIESAAHSCEEWLNGDSNEDLFSE